MKAARLHAGCLPTCRAAPGRSRVCAAAPRWDTRRHVCAEQLLFVMEAPDNALVVDVDMAGDKLHAVIKTPAREFQLHVIAVAQLQGEAGGDEMGCAD